MSARAATKPRAIRGGWAAAHDGKCRNCQAPVPKGRRTFCGARCVDEWRIRTDPGHARRLVLARDRGVCEECGIDTVASREALGAARRSGAVEPLRPDELAALARHSVPGARYEARIPSPGPNEVTRARAYLIGFNPWRLTWWDADHRRPVVEGGGVDRTVSLEEALGNLRTLCHPCHRRATAELARRRAERRRGGGGDNGGAP